MQEVIELKSRLETISTLIQELTNTNVEGLSNEEARVAQLIQEHLSGQRMLVTHSGFDGNPNPDQDEAFMVLLRKHFPTVAEEKLQELQHRATSIKEDVEDRLFKRVKDYLDAKQPGDDSPANEDETGSQNPPKSPTDEPTTDAGGQPPPDNDDLGKPGGYAGYKHQNTNEKRLAYIIRRHRQLRSGGFIFVRDFETLTEAAKWLNQQESFPQPFPPMHHVRR